MNTGPRTNNGSSNCLNFSDALTHLRWGDRVARRIWKDGIYLHTVYRNDGSAFVEMAHPQQGAINTMISGTHIMAEDRYVIGAHQ